MLSGDFEKNLELIGNLAPERQCLDGQSGMECMHSQVSRRVAFRFLMQKMKYDRT